MYGPYLNDPLRILAIRFGTAFFFIIIITMSISDLLFGFCDYSTAITCARFGFILDEELKQAASSEEVRVALGEKNSKEGIGNEVCI